ncbi:MAG: glycerol-3-phosphate 1-O-acyltransferase [Proteobacteria bacterium]|nr:glycerol-3-phosphate 1-O-acyltransferase [Verrucomicrobiota bacterium]NBU07572.1 glycerol-3-phosphate 1-O-acyltransferase [Pseudomonadota bacterium]
MITLIFLSYLLGSIPTGFLVAKAKGVDIRSVGSGNIGATNVFRILGKGAGIFVLTVDAMKGALAVSVIGPFVERGYHLSLPVFSSWTSSSSNLSEIMHHLPALAGICAILGHNYTCWLRFKGGKGIATTAGVFAALAPAAFGIALATWLVVFAASRYVSLASIVAAVALPLAVWLTGNGALLIGVSTALGALAIYKHKANIERLRAGTENRIGTKNPESPASAPEEKKS